MELDRFNLFTKKVRYRLIPFFVRNMFAKKIKLCPINKLQTAWKAQFEANVELSTSGELNPLLKLSL